jgi:hypothetical protein
MEKGRLPPTRGVPNELRLAQFAQKLQTNYFPAAPFNTAASLTPALASCFRTTGQAKSTSARLNSPPFRWTWGYTESLATP